MDDLKTRIADEMPHLRRFAYSLTDDPNAADDLTQAALERAIRKRWLWRRKGTLRSWLFRILYTTHLNRIQADKKHTGVSTEGLETSLSVAPRQEGIMNCLQMGEALDKLPHAQRDALVLVALEDMPYEVAAGVLGVPVGTLRSRISRAREALRATSIPRETRLRRVK